MIYQEFSDQFKFQTKNLNYHRQIKFAIEICKKLYFDYQKFCDKYNWGNAGLVMDTVRYIENFEESTDKDQLDKKLKLIKEITPDTEDFQDVSYALNCCVAVCETLEFLIDQKVEHIHSIGICYYDTVYIKIQEGKEIKEYEIDPEIIAAYKYLLEASA